MFQTFLSTLLKSDLNTPNIYSINSVKDFHTAHEAILGKQKPYVLSLNLQNFSKPEKLLTFAVPKIVVVTNLGDSHLVYQKEQHILSARIRHFLAMLPSETIIVLNKDDDLVSELEDDLPNKQIIKYGFNTSSEFFASKIEQNGHQGVSFLLNDKTPISVKIFQYTQVYNMLSAITVARLFNVKLNTIKERLAKEFMVPSGRCNLIQFKNFSILNDTFNHSFQNVTTAAQTLVTFKNYSNKMIMVIGDIDDAHSDPKQLHVNIGHFLAALPIDVILTFGLYAKYIEEGIRLIPNENRTIIHSNSASEVLMNLQLFLEANDTILLKAHNRSGINRFLGLINDVFGADQTPKSAQE